MTIIQKRKILTRIQNLERDIETLKQVRLDLASSEFVSATLSSGGGSKSYTRQNIGQLNETISELIKELNQYRNMIATDSTNGFNFGSVLVVYG